MEAQLVQSYRETAKEGIRLTYRMVSGVFSSDGIFALETTGQEFQFTLFATKLHYTYYYV